MKNAQLDHTNEKGEHGFVTNKRQSSRQPATTIHDLDFADDIALLESSLERAQAQLTQTAKWANKVGLQINTKKTQALTNQNTNNNTIQLNGQDIEWVDNFKYLGSMMLSSITDIKVRKGQAWKAFWKMKNIWKSTAIPTQLKIKIFKASCVSILLYGCETLAYNRSGVQPDQSFQQHLQHQIQKHQHFLFAPCTLILLNLPRLIISFTNGCMRSARKPWLYLIGYFVSFIPSMLIFFVFILPSNNYKNEFNTMLQETMIRFRWYRHCGLIPYTQDVDFGLFAEEYDENIRKYFLGNPTVYLWGALGLVNDSLEFRLFTGRYTFDLFWAYREDDHRWCGYQVQRDKYRRILPLLPKLCSCDLFGYRFSIPCSPVDYLNNEYGYDLWKNPLEKNYTWINIAYHSKWDDISWMYAVRLYTSKGELRQDKFAIDWIANHFNYSLKIIPSFLNVVPNQPVTLPPIKN
ncbi:unnamed protein product [Rotaria sp. Silwood1]|nr:unnamed protein product [Rotaria sp. Silwood1]